MERVSLGPEATQPLANSWKAEIFFLNHPLQSYFALFQKSPCFRRARRKLYSFHLKYTLTPSDPRGLCLRRQDLYSGSQQGLDFPWRTTTPLCYNPTWTWASVCFCSPPAVPRVWSPAHSHVSCDPGDAARADLLCRRAATADGCTRAFEPTLLIPPFRSPTRCFQPSAALNLKINFRSCLQRGFKVALTWNIYSSRSPAARSFLLALWTWALRNSN